MNQRNRKDMNNGVYATMNMSKKPASMKDPKEFLKGVKDGSAEGYVNNMFGSIPGTKEYWLKRRNDLTALQQAYGSPTFFCSFSCAEYHWEDMQKFLQFRNADLTSANMNQLITADPTGVAKQFRRRVDSLFRDVILARSRKDGVGPVGKVEHYFWRYEYQACGAPHIHCLLWIKDAPILKPDMSNEDEVREFIDKHITCRLPDEDDIENAQLRRLVLSYQSHNACNAGCKRIRHRKNEKKMAFCHFGFPRKICSETRLRSMAQSVKMRIGSGATKKIYDLRRSHKEIMINDYNPALLMAWNANMDIQYIGDESLVFVRYVSGYVGKHDKGNFAPLWKEINRDAGLRRRLWVYAAETFKQREFGQLEAADRLLQHSLFKFSWGDSPKFLNTKPPSKRFRKLRKYEEVERIIEANKRGSLFYDNYDENRYPNHPASWEDVNLMEVFRWWNDSKKAPDNGVDVTDLAYSYPDDELKDHDSERNDQDVLGLYGGTGESFEEEEPDGENIANNGEGDDDDGGGSSKKKKPKEKKGRKKTPYVVLPDDLGFLCRRQKAAVVATSFYHSKTEESQELQFRALLILYKLYRNFDELKGEFETYREAWADYWEINQEARWAGDRRMRQTVEKVEEIVKRLEDEAVRENADGDGERYVVEDEDKYHEVDAEKENEGCVVAATEVLCDEDIERMVNSQNEDQHRVHAKIISGIRHQEKCKDSTCTCGLKNSNSSDQILQIVSGVGGTGKSFLIKCLSASLTSEYGESGGMCVARMAPTGIAAYNIDGETLHRTLCLRPQQNGKMVYEQLRKHQVKEIREKLKNVKLFIIDEYSMVSTLMLNMIHHRLEQIFLQKRSRNMKARSFGGRNILLIGDVLQLKPVRGNFCFEAMGPSEWEEAGGGIPLNIDLISDFDYDELEINMRQSGDADFQNLLDNIRLGNLSATEAGLLESRIVCSGKSIKEQAQYFQEIQKVHGDALYLVPTCSQADKFNMEMLAAEGIEVQEIRAIDMTSAKKSVSKKEIEKSSRKKRTADTGGLEAVLKIGVGAQVMLRRNLDQEKGLVNGSLGIVKNILKDGMGCVAKIDVEFEKAGIVPIDRFQGDYEISPRFFFSRKQFPLCLSYAITIHRCQGLTLNAAIIDLSDSVFEPGMAYVALSRVKSLESIHLVNLGQTAIRANYVAVKAYNNLRISVGKEPKLPYNRRDPPYDRKHGCTVTAEVVVSNSDGGTKKKGKGGRAAGGSGVVLCGPPDTTFLMLPQQRNLCFTNSLLQALLGCDGLGNLVGEEDSQDVVLNELKNLFLASSDGSSGTCTSQRLSQAVMQPQGQIRGVQEQQDAMEMWDRLVHLLPKHVLDLFCAQRRYRRKCNGCDAESDWEKQQIVSLLISVPNGCIKFSDCIDNHFKENEIEDFRCGSCGLVGTATEESCLRLEDRDAGVRNLYLFVGLELFHKYGSEPVVGAEKCGRCEEKLMADRNEEGIGSEIVGKGFR